jgi:uncharacterized phage protein (TIGR02218 family)
VTFEQYENSEESGRPIEIFHFSIGLENFYYTSAEDTITYGGNQYVTRQITRTSVKESVEGGKARLEVTLPTDDLVCSRYVGIVEPSPMYLNVIRFHRQDLLDGRVVWTGRLTTVKYQKNGTRAQMTFIPSESVYSRAIPHYKYQALCNHVLYDDGCGIDPDSYKFTGTATGASGSNVTVTGLQASKGADWAKGGKCTVNGVDRLILDQSGDVLSLSLPFGDDPDGQTIDVFAGCDHQVTTCGNKFGNAVNYGGFPFVPTKNPFQVGVR